MKSIVLIGYMASGKSAVGIVLAEKLNLKFIDLDAYIVSKTGLSIGGIFETKGEIYFRKIESECLLGILEAQSGYILAVGGGTPCYGNNMESINKYAFSVFLKTPLKVLVNRLKAEKQNRPLVSSLSDADLTEFVAKHLFERHPFYEKAQLTIDVKERGITEIINEIAVV
ncbi:MAG: shikimate kinase [Flavobacteriales bacterium]|jgi:shikimate kinase|nr:shikimate kinase [Flavobacteriales bacterium]